MSSEFLIRPINFMPLNNAAMGSSGSGGGWANGGNHSFLVVAWWVGTDESIVDYAGWKRSQTTDWENVALSVGGYATITWDTPLDQNGEKRYPDHYKIYVQEDSATWDFGVAGTECYVNVAEDETSVAGTATSATLYDIASTEKTFPLAANMTEVTICPILDLRPKVRVTTVRGFDGRLTDKSYSHSMPLDGLEIDIVSTSMTHAHYGRIMLFIYRSTHCRIEDTDTNSYIQYYYGRFDNATHIGSPSKSSRDVNTLYFKVENCGLR